MANEIRVLEDQLYEADYQNQVLREKLQRAKKSQSFVTPPMSYGPPPSRSQSKTTQPTPLKKDADMGLGFGEPIVDSEAFGPAETVPPPDPEQSDPEDTEDTEVLPAPGGPEPPGPGDVEVPPIEPGDILPPPAPGEQNAAPPGKVEVPKSLGTLPAPTPIPEQLKLHSGLSGGHRFDDDDETDGLYLVVNVIDDHGRMIDLNEFDIDAEMTIVALDPMLDASQARIARWEYAADEVRQFIRSAPVAGLHVPVRWQELRPSGDEVIVHVRLQTADEEMLCNGRLKVDGPESIADWTPRGGKKSR